MTKALVFRFVVTAFALPATADALVQPSPPPAAAVDVNTKTKR